MSSLTRAANHLTVEQVKEKLKEAKDVVQYKRWLIVYNALIAPRRASEMAELLAVSIDSVHQIIVRYNREGPQALETQRAGGRYHATLSLSEEQAFLTPFFERAQAGELATIQEIHHAFEAHIGKSVYETTIYRLLAGASSCRAPITPSPIHTLRNSLKKLSDAGRADPSRARTR